MKQKLRDILTGTTTIVMIPEDMFYIGEMYDIPCVKCCEIGPVIDADRYCNKCGKRIVRK
jgi:hypothetical protein